MSSQGQGNEFDIAPSHKRCLDPRRYIRRWHAVRQGFTSITFTLDAAASELQSWTYARRVGRWRCRGRKRTPATSTGKRVLASASVFSAKRVGATHPHSPDVHVARCGITPDESAGTWRYARRLIAVSA